MRRNTDLVKHIYKVIELAQTLIFLDTFAPYLK